MVNIRHKKIFIIIGAIIVSLIIVRTWLVSIPEYKDYETQKAYAHKLHGHLENHG